MINKKFYRSDWVFGFLLLFLIGIPALQYSAIGIVGVYNEKRVLELILFLLIGLLTLLGSFKGNDSLSFLGKLPKHVVYGLFITFLMGVCSSFFAEFPEWAFLDVGHYTLIIIFTLLVAAYTSNNELRSLVYIEIAVLGYVSIFLFRIILTYFLHLFGDYPLWPGSETSIGLFGFADKRFFNHTQTWTFPILISMGWYYWNYSNKQLARYGLLILSIGWGILAIASGARGTVLGVGLSFSILAGFFALKPWQFIKYVLGLSIASFGSYYIFFETLSEGSNYTLVRSDSSGRLATWIELVPEILSKPFFGYGPMHYNSITLDNWLGAPHSWFFQFAYEWGLIVALILLVIICLGLSKFFLSLNSTTLDKDSLKKYWLKLGLFWSMTAVFIHSFFSGLINTALSQGWFILITGVSIGLYFKSKDKEPSISPVSSSYLFIILMLLSFGFIINWGANHSLKFEKLNRIYIKQTGENSIPTRYWQQPKIGYDYETPKEEKSNKSNL